MQKRNVLWWLMLFQMFCNTLVTLSINIAIVSMVNTNDYADESHQTVNAICPNTTLFLSNFYDSSNKTSSSISTNIGYDWSETEQNTALSGYYWLNYFSILPGGVLAHRFGSKRVVGFAQIISSVMSSLIPVFAQYGSLVVAWIRAIQGLLSFMSVPAGMYTIIGNWSPPHERGKFGNTFIVGSAAGLAVGSFCFGYVAQYLHWKYVFHLTSICGIIWSVFWFTLIYDSPEQHPTISPSEREYIKNSLKKSLLNTKISIPWKSIVCSVPVVISILASNSQIWSFVMLSTYVPVYLKTLYGLNSNEIGILTSIPPFIGALVAVVFGYYSDLIVRKGIASITNMRKTSAFLGCIVSHIPLIFLAYTKCNVHVVIICIFLCTIIRVCNMFGPGLVVMDLSPKFCGVLEGFSGTSSSIQTFVFSAMINYLTSVWDIEELWKIAFLFTAAFSIITNVIFVIFGTAEVQEWNFEHPNQALKENKPLNPILKNSYQMVTT